MNRLHLVGKRTTWLPVVFVRMSKGRNYLSLTSARNAEMKAMIWLYLRFVKTNEGGKSIVNVTQESSSRWFIPFHRGISSLDHHSGQVHNISSLCANGRLFNRASIADVARLYWLIGGCPLV